MSKRQYFIWSLYLLYFSLITFGSAAQIFSKSSPQFQYFYILVSFDPAYFFSYFLTLTQVILNIVNLMPLFLFITRIKFLPAAFWQYLLILRFVFDIVGHPFEMNNLMSYLKSDPNIFIFLIVSSIITHAPSYGTCFYYAFRQDRLFSKS